MRESALRRHLRAVVALELPVRVERAQSAAPRDRRHAAVHVFPNELENVISLCPGVVECAAVGVPDAMQGESIKVFVVKNDPLLTEDDLARYCRENFTGYKIPKYIEFRDELPKTNVGKILRRELRPTAAPAPAPRPETAPH